MANYEFYNLGGGILIDRADRGKPTVVVVVEYKREGEFKSESDKLLSVRRCNDVARELGAKIGIATDGTDFIWFNPLQKSKADSFTYIQNAEGKLLTEKFLVTNKADESNIDKLDDQTRNTINIVNNLYNLLDEENSIVTTPEPINPMQLAKTVWQDIWIATGKSPEKCLYNVVELFIFKFLSDLGILKGSENFDHLFGLYAKGRSNEDVLHHYAKVCRDRIYTLFEPGEDGTTIINGTIFVNEQGEANLTQSILFRNSLKKFLDFGKLQNIDNEFKTKLYETFLKETQGLKGLGQYFTPRKVVRAVVNMSGINDLKKGQSVCDPFCGVGGFLLEPINLYNKIKRGFIPIDGVINPDIKFTGFDKGSEKDEERTIILAKANMLIYLSEIIAKYSTLTLEFSRMFNDIFRLLKTNLGTLGVKLADETEKFDLILTNPPYVTRGKRTISNEIADDADLSEVYTVKGIGLEGLALNWIMFHLKSGGSAFVIIPDGLLNRIHDRDLRNEILKCCYINAIISLPKKTFFATSKKTYILSITKKDKPEDEQVDPVFTYLVDTIGERLDVTRFDTPGSNDLLEMTSLFNQFKDDKEGFNTVSPKCKIQPIERFVNEASWIIDRWWTDEEKETLGIIELEDVISLEEFQEKIDNLRDSLLVAKKELDKITDSENITFREFRLEELCDLSKTTNRSSFTRSFVDQHKGDVPVYSASKTPDFTGYGNIKDHLPGVKYFENCLTWNIDGYVGKAFYRTGRFTLSEKVIPLILFEKYQGKVDYMYIRSVLQKEASKRDLGFSNKAGKARIADIPIKIPIDKDGHFNLEKQRELALNYKRIEDIKEQISEELKSFNESVIEL